MSDIIPVVPYEDIKAGHDFLVTALQFTKPGTTQAQPEPAWEFVRRAVQRGVMLFAPVGVGGCAVKLNPPLVIKEDALREGLGVLEEIAREL